MSGDIKPLSSLNSMPLVREKRHYPGDQNKQQQKKQQQKEEQLSSTENEEEPEVDAEVQGSDKEDKETNVDSDEKNFKVKHIDEYA